LERVETLEGTSTDETIDDILRLGE
jgi:hypothetical protein